MVSSTNNSQGAVTWANAPACPYALADNNSKKDSYGRRWGWANGASCAFRNDNGSPVFTWATAPRCLLLDPATSSSAPDKDGHVWATDGSCAFKDANNQPVLNWAAAVR